MNNKKVVCILLFGITTGTLNYGCNSIELANQNSKPEISADDISYHIRYLASDELGGRKAGTKGAEQAAEYIANEFKRFGLEPVGDDSSHHQKFDFVGGVILGSKNQLGVKIDGLESSYEVEANFMPLAFSSLESVSAEVVFAGYGISSAKLNYDDYDGIDVTDKIVVVLRYGPEGDNPHSDFYEFASLRSKATAAREHGAKGIIFVTGPESYQEDELAKLKYDYSFADSGIPAISVSRKIVDKIIQAAGRELGKVQNDIDGSKQNNSFPIENVIVSFATDVRKERKLTSNIVGLLSGRDGILKDEVIIIGAHYDHLGLGGSASLAAKEGEIHNGADDNASGVAGLLELAQVFSTHTSELKRSILFMAFSAEEAGVLGSAHYVKNPLFPLEKTVTMINMDMIGRLKDKQLSIHGIGTSPLWEELVRDVNSESMFDLKLSKDGYGPSDHSSFYGKGLPVLFFFTGVHEDYHKPSDDFDSINVAGEEEIVKYIYSVAHEINIRNERPVFTKVAGSSDQRTGRGFRVYLGTIPDYSDEVEGVKLSGVREGSPAENAGLQSDDIIVRFGATNIKNIYDYVYALGQHKPYDEVDIVVLRNGKELSLRVRLEKRN